jgi:WhiB family redox-sensing transcriptional regulator
LTEVIVPLAHVVVVHPDEVDDLGWQDRALCAQTDPEAFFPEKGGSTREAKRVCRACEVRTECLEYALEHDERFGIWGGMSERERRRLKRQAVLGRRDGTGLALVEVTRATRSSCAAQVPSRVPEQALTWRDGSIVQAVRAGAATPMAVDGHIPQPTPLGPIVIKRGLPAA